MHATFLLMFDIVLMLCLNFFGLKLFFCFFCFISEMADNNHGVRV